MSPTNPPTYIFRPQRSSVTIFRCVSTDKSSIETEIFGTLSYSKGSLPNNLLIVIFKDILDVYSNLLQAPSLSLFLSSCSTVVSSFVRSSRIQSLWFNFFTRFVLLLQSYSLRRYYCLYYLYLCVGKLILLYPSAVRPQPLHFVSSS